MSTNCYLVDKSQRRISVIQQKESIQYPPKTQAQEHSSYAEFNVFSRQNAKSNKPKVLIFISMTTRKITSILTSTKFHKLNFQKTLKKIPPSIEPEKTPFK